MKKLRDNVYMFESVKASRVYLLTLADRAVMIDTSFPGRGQKLLTELAEIDLKPDSISDILITHHDIDHIGSAAFIKQATGAKVWMHELDIAHEMGTTQRPPAKRVLGLFMHTTPPEIEGIIRTDAEIIPGIHAIHTAGHTPGHTVYLWQDVLFSGDAVTVKKDGQLALGPSIMNANQQAAGQSLKLIESIAYRLICPSHAAPFERA